MLRRRSRFYMALVGFLLNAILIYPDELAESLLQDMDRSLFPVNFIAKMRMTNHKPGKEEQTFEIVVYRKEESGSLLVFAAPPSERGKKMLLVANTIWFYVPGTSRAVSLSSRQPFMGSAFSNSDLMDSTMQDDYDPRVMAEEKVEGRDTYVLELTAKDKKVTYKKIIYGSEKITKYR